jgi:hypothetical protein
MMVSGVRSRFREVAPLQAFTFQLIRFFKMPTLSLWEASDRGKLLLRDLQCRKRLQDVSLGAEVLRRHA